MITFVCWKWKQPNYRTLFTAEHANVWRAGLARHYQHPHRAICVTDDPSGVNFETFPLWSDLAEERNPSGAHLPSCYRRLKIFDSQTTAEMDIDEGSYVVSVDLDVVFVRDLEPLFAAAPANFMGWRGIGSYNPVVYNGSLFRFIVGKMDYLWTEFNAGLSPMETQRHRYFGSDQGWISYKISGTAPGWGATDGVLSYTSDMHGGRAVLPKYARVVSFNGKRKPWDADVQTRSPWIREHWRT